jgi:diguanylate cyclase (GGDEF)-like protein
LQLGIVALIVSVLTVLRFDGLLAHVRHQARAFDRLARLDPLTGIANRRQWDEALAGLCAHADAVHQRLASDGDADLEAGTQSQTRLCLAVLDLDHFKEFNDAHGHAEGDRLLCETVQAWTGLLADTDLLARVGGEEFAVLMPGRDLVDAHLLTEVLLEATPRGRSCSAGLTERPPGTDPAAAMIRADRALYEAKANGRAQVRVAADPNTPDGLAALPTIVYQPIVTAAALVVVGYEALSRFADHRPPDTVFRVAHANGYGDLLEAQALLAALDEPGRPHGVELYVNASAAALSSARFLDELPRRLDGVVIELTEDDHALDWARHRLAIATLRARGARIAVDDWGSGAGDLAKLVEVRPDVVKLDASLVAGCAHSAARREVLASAIRLARDNGAIVCAEGLENEEDLVTVRAAGVDLVQGFHLGRPGSGWTLTPADSNAPVGSNAQAGTDAPGTGPTSHTSLAHTR